jgi:hypothetical protein
MNSMLLTYYYLRIWRRSNFMSSVLTDESEERVVFPRGHPCKYWPPSKVCVVWCVQYNALSGILVITACLRNWLLLLYLVIAADITGHVNFLWCHTDTFNVPLYRRREVFHSSNPLCTNCYKFYRPRKDRRLGWPCLYWELNRGSPVWARMS